MALPHLDTPQRFPVLPGRLVNSPPSSCRISLPLFRVLWFLRMFPFLFFLIPSSPLSSSHLSLVPDVPSVRSIRIVYAQIVFVVGLRRSAHLACETLLHLPELLRGARPKRIGVTFGTSPVLDNSISIRWRVPQSLNVHHHQ